MPFQQTSHPNAPSDRKRWPVGRGVTRVPVAAPAAVPAPGPGLVPVALLAAVLIFSVSAPSIGAREFRNKQHGYFVDIPESWAVLDGSDSSQVSFSDPSSRAALQILTFPPDRFDSAERIAAYVRDRFRATGDTASFTYRGEPAVLSDLTFSTGSYEARGYFLFLDGTESVFGSDFVAMSTAPVSHYARFHDELLSALNSFAPDARSRSAPGPVSQFYYAFPPPGTEQRVAKLPPPSGVRSGNGGPDARNPGTRESSGTETAEAPHIEVSYRIDPAEAEVSQIFIEREARILSAYAPSAQLRWGGTRPGWKAAWKRYYRVIYRDNYLRLESLAEALDRRLRAEGVPREEIPRLLLRWLHEFRYVRVPTLSDLSSPVTAVIEETGDCDSLGLVYTILLDHMGFDTILLVSRQYSHALAGVVTEGEGARYRFEGRSYLLAELTEDVELGLIPREMADAAAWVPIRLR